MVGVRHPANPRLRVPAVGPVALPREAGRLPAPVRAGHGEGTAATVVTTAGATLAAATPERAVVVTEEVVVTEAEVAVAVAVAVETAPDRKSCRTSLNVDILYTWLFHPELNCLKSMC